MKEQRRPECVVEAVPEDPSRSDGATDLYLIFDGRRIAPSMTRVAVLRDCAIAAGIGQFAVIQSVAGSVGVDVIPVNLNEAAEIERELVTFAQSANGGMCTGIRIVRA